MATLDTEDERHRVAVSRPPGLWRHRDFRLLWSAETISQCGSAITTVAMPLVAVSTLQASTFLVGLLATAVWLPSLLFGLHAGAWVDRVGSRRIMLACNIAAAVVLGSVPVASALGLLGSMQLLIVAFLVGIATVFFRTALPSYLPSLVGPEHLVEGNAKLHGSISAAELVGPGIAGLIARWFGAVAALLVDAFTFLIATVCLLGIRTREGGRSTPARVPMTRQIGEGLRFVAGDRYLRPMALFAASGNLSAVGVQALLVVFLVRGVGVEPGTIGLLMASMGAGGIIGALVATRVARRFGTARGLLLAVLCTEPFCLLIPLTGTGPRLILFVVGLLVMSVGIVVSSVITASFRQAYCPPRLLGRVTASMRLPAYAAMPIGGVLSGVLGTVLGTRAALWILSGWVALSGLILLFSAIRHDRDLPA